MNLLSILQDEEEIVKPIEQPSRGVYYLPTLLTNVQKDLLELNIEIFRQELNSVSQVKKQRTSIDSLLDNTRPNSPSFESNGHAVAGDASATSNGNSSSGSSGAGYSSVDKINLLFEQLRLVDRHPSLLVDHFIPRKLLLSDTNERMMNISGKFQLFDRIVDSFIDRYPVQQKEETAATAAGGDWDSPGVAAAAPGSSSTTKGYNMLVVASSVKELELIEGVIIGKKLFYKNLSSGKLYEDNREMPKFNNKEQDDADSTRNGSDREGELADGDTTANLDDHVRGGGRSHRKRSKQGKGRGARAKRMTHYDLVYGSSLCLYLITTQQLYNYSFDISMDLIVSFDVSIDTESPNVELIRSTTSSSWSSLDSPVIKTPILIPIPALSIEHCILKNPPPQPSQVQSFSASYNNGSGRETSAFENPYFKWKLHVINTFITNRHQLFGPKVVEQEEDFYLHCYGNNVSQLYDWFNDWGKVSFHLSGSGGGVYDFDTFLKEKTGKHLHDNFSDSELHHQLKRNFLFDFGPIANDSAPKSVRAEGKSISKSENVDYKSFKRHFAKILIERVATIDKSINEKFDVTIDKLRERESAIQNEIDQDNLKIGERYRELQKCNEDASVSERKVIRVENDHSKLVSKENLLHSRVAHLKEILMIKDSGEAKEPKEPVTLSSAAEPSIDILINSQFATIDELRSKLASVNAELSKLTAENDKVRAQYQESSNEAVAQSVKLNKLKDVNEKLQSKLNGPGSSLIPDLLRKDELINYEFELNKVKGVNSFMDNLLSEKLNKIIKERQGIMETTGGGSSSRGARLSRASTPFT